MWLKLGWLNMSKEHQKTPPTECLKTKLCFWHYQQGVRETKCRYGEKSCHMAHSVKELRLGPEGHKGAHLHYIFGGKESTNPKDKWVAHSSFYGRFMIYIWLAADNYTSQQAFRLSCRMLPFAIPPALQYCLGESPQSTQRFPGKSSAPCDWCVLFRRCLI